MGRFFSVSFGLLVVFLSLSGIGAGLCCPLGWSSFDQHCYKVFEPVKNWTEAEEICMQQHKGSRLASIHSSEEEAFVSKLASKALKFTSMWIGLNNPWKECKWEWSDNARFDYKAWKRRPYCTVMVVKPAVHHGSRGLSCSVARERAVSIQPRATAAQRSDRFPGKGGFQPTAPHKA